MNTNSFNICVIQGDDYIVVYQFIDSTGKILDNTVIENVYMSCEKLNYQSTLTWNQIYNGYALSIPANTTANFEQMVTNYDLTVYFLNGCIQTEVYESQIRVLLKRNKVIT